MAQNSELPQLPTEGDKAKKSKTGEAPTGAGARLHLEASKEWAREAEALRHKPLPVKGNEKYEIHHGDCLSDIAYRSLKTDHKKVNPREIAKEEARLRELNGKEFPSLQAHDKKHRNFLPMAGN